jgi:hypothetical protein
MTNWVDRKKALGKYENEYTHIIEKDLHTFLIRIQETKKGNNFTDYEIELLQCVGGLLSNLLSESYRKPWYRRLLNFIGAK